MIYIGIVLTIFIIDGLFKSKVEKSMALDSTKPLFGGKLLLRRHHNKGFSMNRLDKYPYLVRIVAVAFTIVVSIFFLMTLGQKGNHSLKLGLAFLLGGAFSNTYDRIRRKFVVDYVSFGVPVNAIRRIIFNISDFCIMIGCLIAAISMAK